MSFPHRVSGLRLRDGMRSLDTQRDLGVELLRFCVERSLLRWFGRLVRIPFGHVPLEIFHACQREIIYLIWIGNASEPPGETGKCCRGEGHLEYFV